MNKVACTLSPMTCSKNWALLLVGPGHQGGVGFLFPSEIGCKKFKVLGGPFKGEVVRVVIWGPFFSKKMTHHRILRLE